MLVLANSRFVTWPLDGKYAEITLGESSSFLEIARQLCLYFFFENLGNFLEYNVFKLRNTESWVLSNKGTLTPRRHAGFKIIQWLKSGLFEIISGILIHDWFYYHCALIKWKSFIYSKEIRFVFVIRCTWPLFFVVLLCCALWFLIKNPSSPLSAEKR